MIYYKTTDIKKEKYEMTCDKQTLKRIKEDLIKNCSTMTIERKQYNSLSKPKNTDNNHIVVLGKKLISEVDGPFDTTGEDYNVYEYTYELYKHHKLVGIINGLINDKEDAITELNNYKIEDISEQLNLAKENIETIDDVENVKHLIQESANLNKIVDYLDQIKKAIKVTFIASIRLDILEEVDIFYDRI